MPKTFLLILVVRFLLLSHPLSIIDIHTTTPIMIGIRGCVKEEMTENGYMLLFLFSTNLNHC